MPRIAGRNRAPTLPPPPRRRCAPARRFPPPRSRIPPRRTGRSSPRRARIAAKLSAYPRSPGERPWPRASQAKTATPSSARSLTNCSNRPECSWPRWKRSRALVAGVRREPGTVEEAGAVPGGKELFTRGRPRRRRFGVGGKSHDVPRGVTSTPPSRKRACRPRRIPAIEIRADFSGLCCRSHYRRSGVKGACGRGIAFALSPPPVLRGGSGRGCGAKNMANDK